MPLVFPPIKPGVIDDFQFDFTNEVGASVIQSSTWFISVSPYSTVADSSPSSRLIGSPSNDNTSTTQRFGNGINGVTYWFKTTVTLNDGRVLVGDGEVTCTDEPLPSSTVFTVEEFRREYPVFADAQVYTDEQVSFWINIAAGTPLINPVIDSVRWGQFYSLGLRLYVAHNLALERMAQRAVLSGGAPVGAGVPQSKSVGPVSVSYDVEFGSETDAGNFSLTIYGSRFIRMLRMAGSAPIQL